MESKKENKWRTFVVKCYELWKIMLKLEACALESYNIGIAKNAFFPEDGDELGFKIMKWAEEEI